MDDKMTIGDALNIANVASDCLADHGDQDVRELAIAARRLVSHIAEQSRELEREQARCRSLARGNALRVEGDRLEEGTDVGGRRDFLAGRAVHAGQGLCLLTCLGWQPVRYESNMPHQPVLYMPLPGVQQDVVIAVPREARFAWPEGLRRREVFQDGSRASWSASRV
jgi:hypothetical protein